MSEEKLSTSLDELVEDDPSLAPEGKSTVSMWC